MKLLRNLTLACSLIGFGFGASAADGDAKQLAFPGAEGFGRFAKGARAVTSPEIYHVTNLNDAGAGSFRDAVSKEGRIIIFDVAGTIKLKSALVVKGKNTILGQTAPGEGIQLYGDRTSFSGANDLIVRHMRFRMGKGGTSGADACGIANGTDMIFDHISAMWGRDETFSVSWDKKGVLPGNITIQNSIIGQGLMSHSAGGLIQTDGGVTLYRNLYIDNNTRNAKVKGLNQYVNNVVYNWSNGAYIMGDTEGASWAQIENNYFINGRWGGPSKPFTRGSEAFHYYGAGNYHDNNKNGALDGDLLTIDQMNGTQGDGRHSTWVESLEALNSKVIHEVIHEGTGSNINYDVITSEKDRTIPQPIVEIAGKMTAQEAVAWIIENVGPTLPARDEVDQYLIDDLMSFGTKGTRSGISDETTLPHGGTGTISGGVKPLDTDNDGMPDEWEIANGLNPNDASDAVAIAANGYMNIENYANSITEAYPYIKKPVKLAVGETTKTSVALTWDVNKNTDCGFVIETSTDGGVTFTEAATVPAGTASTELTGLTPMTQYQVRLRATDGKGLYSDYTETLAFETAGDPSAPFASELIFPANGAKEGVANGITFTWKNDRKAYGGDLTYTLYLGTDAENLTAAAQGLTATEWNCTTLEANKTYYWRVDATNTLGTTPSEVYNFTTTAGGVLFYADFNTKPEAYGAAYAEGLKAGNVTIFAKGTTNQTKEFNGMIIGVGETKSRVMAMNGSYSDDLTKDYGPASEDDKGASSCAVQFTEGNGYITTPAVQGPCTVTYYLGNTGSSQQTVKLYTIAGGQETVQDLVIGAKKRVFKFNTSYTNAGEVQFRLESNGKKINVNDILIERYIAPDGNQPLEMTSGSLSNEIDYTDGSVSLTFNQEVKYNGTATITGQNKFETISVGTSNTKLNIAYEALDANSEYVINFPAGALTDVTGEKSFVGEVKLVTGDFPRAKESGETHWGKAIKTLPANFAPFNEVAPFETVGSLVQTKQGDYPHWCQVGGGTNAGEVAADHVTFRSASSSDKVMAYFDGTAKKIYLEVSAEAGTSVRLKVQETRNADIAPTWRTMRVLTEKDLPFKGELELNPESRFVKITPASVSGAVSLNAFRISDANGSFGPDFSGIADVIASQISVRPTADGILVSGLAAGVRVNVYDIAGRTVAAATADGSDVELTLSKGGFYLVSAAGKTFKIRF